jgi:hypothetical protein
MRHETARAEPDGGLCLCERTMKLYLLINAALYLLLAIWCTVKHTSTAAGSCYVELNNSGHSEYLVIYGGLQLGLAAIFAYLGFHAEYHRLGLLVALMFYVPIVLYRGVTILLYKPVSTATLAIGALEAVLLIVALVLWLRSAGSVAP